MKSIPTDNRSQLSAKASAKLTEYNKVMGRDNPAPVAVPSGDVESQTELMVTLPRSRFAGPIGEQLSLPRREAQCLKDFVAGLQDAGFAQASDFCVNRLSSPDKIRVKVIYASQYSRFFHGHSSAVKNVKRSESLAHIASEERAQPCTVFSTKSRT